MLLFSIAFSGTIIIGSMNLLFNKHNLHLLWMLQSKSYFIITFTLSQYFDFDWIFVKMNCFLVLCTHLLSLTVLKCSNHHVTLTVFMMINLFMMIANEILVELIKISSSRDRQMKQALNFAHFAVCYTY